MTKNQHMGNTAVKKEVERKSLKNGSSALLPFPQKCTKGSRLRRLINALINLSVSIRSNPQDHPQDSLYPLDIR